MAGTSVVSAEVTPIIRLEGTKANAIQRKRWGQTAFGSVSVMTSRGAASANAMPGRVRQTIAPQAAVITRNNA